MGCRCQPEKHEHYLALEERLWNVHHAGEPMPGAKQADEDGDIIMEGSRADISKNPKCPITGVEASPLPMQLAARPCLIGSMASACVVWQSIEGHLGAVHLRKETDVLLRILHEPPCVADAAAPGSSCG